MSEEVKRVKIEYYYNTLTWTELLVIYMCVSTLFLMIIPTIILVSLNRDVFNNITYIIVEVVSLALAIPFLIAGYGFRKEKRKWPEFMKTHGKKFMGHIVSLEEIEIGKRIGTKGFSYKVEYEDPDTGKAAILNTPRLLKDKMCVMEEDLPIEAVLYVYKGMAYADEIINPPTRKMNKRRFYKWLPLMLAVPSLIIDATVDPITSEMTFENMIHVGFSISALLFIAAFWAYVSDIHNKEL